MPDRRGIPLAVRIIGANRHDSAVVEELLNVIRPIRRPRGHRRYRPAKLNANTVDDIPRCRRTLSCRHILVRIARTGVESSEKLGWHRWVVERTVARLNCYRRLSIRYERRDDIHQAFLSFGWCRRMVLLEPLGRG